MSVFMYDLNATADMLTFFALVFMIVLLVIFERTTASRYFRRDPSDHSDGLRFFNPPEPIVEAAKQQNRSMWVWLFTRSRGAWTKREVTPSIPDERIHNGIEVTFINHAAVLIQTAGLNIITDPVWSYRASPFPFMGPARYAAPGVRFDDLPPIDIVLLSHNHYDHMDLKTLRRMHKKWAPRIYTGLGNGAYLARKGIPGAHEMDWWNTTHDGPFAITSVPAKHFSARSVSDRNATLWCGFVLETPAGKIYFAGDTGYGAFIQKIADRFAPIALALLPIGAYDPAWMMQPVHANPDEALRMHDTLHAEHSVGIHFGTFRLTDEPQDEPAERIIERRGDRDFDVLSHGATVLIKGHLSENS